MVTDPKERTLYDDWKARRERLAHVSSGAAGYRAIEMRLLDYLLRRYEASPEAARPARFPLLTSVFVNHRAIIVHHHIGRGVIPTIANEQEARAHVRALVDRMWSPSARNEVADLDAGIASCAIPPAADQVEAARMRLCDSNPAVRIQAAVQLGEMGDLDDVGLLSDLLSLPTCPEEHPREREALLHAMQRLSGATTERFDLCGVLPVPEDATSLGSGGSETNRSDKPRADYYFYLFLLVFSAVLFIVGGIMLILTWMT
jgi:hypothetical protein